MKPARKAVTGLFSTAFAIALFASSAAAVTIEVKTSLAPNAFGSPSFAQYQAKSLYALQNNLSSYGDPTQPSYYQVRSTVSAAETVVTGFPSWLGQANPTGAFAAELGNRMTFGLHIFGGQFSISQLSFNAVSSDPFNALGFGYAGGYNYSQAYVGLNYGGDTIRGTGDDVWITSGLSTQVVNELFGRGSGNALAAYMTDPGLTPQDKINDVAAYFSSPTTFTGTYSLDGVDGSGTFLIEPVPEPSTILLLGGGVLAAFVWRRRVQK